MAKKKLDKKEKKSSKSSKDKKNKKKLKKKRGEAAKKEKRNKKKGHSTILALSASAPALSLSPSAPEPLPEEKSPSIPMPEPSNKSDEDNITEIRRTLTPLEERQLLLGRLLDFALNEVLLDEQQVWRWSQRLLSAEESDQLGLKRAADSVPKGRPIRLRKVKHIEDDFPGLD